MRMHLISLLFRRKPLCCIFRFKILDSFPGQKKGKIGRCIFLKLFLSKLIMDEESERIVALLGLFIRFLHPLPFVVTNV